jgi:hypothetical protein
VKTTCQIIFLALAFDLSACAGASWDLAGDWNPPANPNGAWAYGNYGSSNSFVYLTFVTNGVDGGAEGGYLPADGEYYDGGFIYENLVGSAAYGINPGQVSLECNWGTPVARWTAPASGSYNISVSIGGTTQQEGPGFGNNFAQFAGLNINLVLQTGSYADNVVSWTFSNISLNAGTTVDAYVPYQGYADGGDTQAIFHIDAVGASGAPVLTITNSGNQAIVWWSPAFTGWTLQTNNNLATGSWGNYDGSTSTNTVAITFSSVSLFFRLASP